MPIITPTGIATVAAVTRPATIYPADVSCSVDGAGVVKAYPLFIPAANTKVMLEPPAGAPPTSGIPAFSVDITAGTSSSPVTVMTLPIGGTVQLWPYVINTLTGARSTSLRSISLSVVPSLIGADWAIGSVLAGAGFWTPRFQILNGAIVPSDVLWKRDGDADGLAQATLAKDGAGWYVATSANGTDHVFADAVVGQLFRILWRKNAASGYSPESADAKLADATMVPGFATPPAALSAGEWTIASKAATTGNWTPTFKTTRANAAALRWCLDGEDIAAVGRPCTGPDAGGTYTASSSDSSHIIPNGTSRSIRIAVALAANPSTFSAQSADAKTTGVSLTPPAALTDAQWIELSTDYLTGWNPAVYPGTANAYYSLNSEVPIAATEVLYIHDANFQLHLPEDPQSLTDWEPMTYDTASRTWLAAIPRGFLPVANATAWPLRIKYKLAGGVYSPASNVKSFSAGLPSVPVSPGTGGTPATGTWPSFPLRSPAEVAANAIGGPGEQMAHSIEECLDTPGEYLLYHDCAGIWLGKTINGRFYWDHQGNIGLRASQATALKPDPVNSQRVIILGSHTNSIFTPACGMYLSTDKCLSMTQRQSLPGWYGANPRRHNQIIAWDPTSSGAIGTLTTRAYLLLPTTVSGGLGPTLYRTTDGGLNWPNSWTVNSITGTDCFVLRHDPITTGVLYVGCDNGAFKVTNANGTPSWAKMGGGLPTSGGCRDILVFKVGGAVTIFALFPNNGLYKSTNGGTNFTLVPGSNTSNGTYKPFYVAVNPNNLNNILISGGNHAQNCKVTFNSGTSWQTPTVTPRNWPGWSSNSWHVSIADDPTAIIWGHDGKVLAHSCAKIYQSDNGGLNFGSGDDGFDGYSWIWANYNVSWAKNNPNIVSLYCYDNGELNSTDGGKGFTIYRAPEGAVVRPNSFKTGALNADGSRSVASGAESFWDTRDYQRPGPASAFQLAFNSGHRGHAAAFQAGTANVFMGQHWSNNNGAPGSWANLGYHFRGMAPSDNSVIFSSSDDTCTDIKRNGVAATGRTVRFTNGSGPWAFRPHPTNSNIGFMMDYTGDLASYNWAVGGAAGWTVYGLLALTQSIPNSPNNIIAVDIDPSNPARIVAGFIADGRDAMVFLSEANGVAGSWKNISGKLCRQGGMLSLRFHPVSGEIWYCGNGPGRRIYTPSGGGGGTGGGAGATSFLLTPAFAGDEL